MSSELVDVGRLASEMAAATSAASLKTNQGMIDQAIAATDTISGKLDNSYTKAGKAQLDGAMGQVPEMQGVASRLGSLATTAEGDVAGTDIERELQRQAMADLQLGRALSPEQERVARLAARQGFAERGMAVGPGSAAAEILNRDALATAREDARRSFAGNVNQTLTGNRLQRLGAAGGLLGQVAGVRQNAAQLGLQGAQGYIGLDPYQRALGSNIPIASQGPSASMASNVFGSVLQYASDLNNTNYNAQWSEYLGDQNNSAAMQQARLSAGAASGAGKSAMTGALIGAGGAIAGGLIVF